MLGDKLQELRKRKGLTQTEVSEIFKTQQASYSKWELNKRTPDYETIKMIANYYNVSVDYMLENKRKANNKITSLYDELNDEKRNKLIEFCKLFFPDECKKIDL